MYRGIRGVRYSSKLVDQEARDQLARLELALLGSILENGWLLRVSPEAGRVRGDRGHPKEEKWRPRPRRPGRLPGPAASRADAALTPAPSAGVKSIHAHLPGAD
jgi:hypothetical protein